MSPPNKNTLDLVLKTKLDLLSTLNSYLKKYTTQNELNVHPREIL